MFIAFQVKDLIQLYQTTLFCRNTHVIEATWFQSTMDKFQVKVIMLLKSGSVIGNLKILLRMGGWDTQIENTTVNSGEF